LAFISQKYKLSLSAFYIPFDYSKYICTVCLQKDCPTGQLTRRKFLTIYRNMFPDSRAVAFYEHVFRTLDQDGSGTIDFREFLEASNFGIITSLVRN